jgi:ApaG protein
MRGSFFFVAEDGERFDVTIPAFILDAASDAPDEDDAPGPRVLH